MSRKPFTLAAGASAVLFVGVCVLWVASWLGHPSLGWGDARTGTAHWVYSRRGTIAFQSHRDTNPMPLGPNWSSGPEFEGPGLDRYGFHYHSGPTVVRDGKRVERGRYGTWSEFWFELAWPALLTLPLSAYLAWRVVSAGTKAGRRRRMGLCPACGYDLRATPDRCPECGAVPGKSGAIPG